MKFYKLSDYECSVLDKISSETKMDDWFWLQYSDSKDSYYIYDNDEGKVIDFKTGINDLLEGIPDAEYLHDFCDISWQEYVALNNLADTLGVPFNLDCISYIDEFHIDEFIAFLKMEDIAYRKHYDDVLVGKTIYQFGRNNNCFGVVK